VGVGDNRQIQQLTVIVNIFLIFCCLSSFLDGSGILYQSTLGMKGNCVNKSAHCSINR